MFGLFKQTKLKPQPAMLAALAAPSAAPLELLDGLIATTVPEKPKYLESMLPCERAAAARPGEISLDMAFFDAVAEQTGKPAKYILRSSLNKTKIGYLDLPLPAFDMIDPFYDHGHAGPTHTAKRALLKASFYFGIGEVTCDISDGSGILVGAIDRHAKALICTNLGTRVFTHTSKKAAEAIANSSRDMTFAMHCTVPGYIPPEYREKIKEAKTIADRIGGKARLIVEANWKLDAEGTQRRDPLIVIVKGESIAYIDRFDCTAQEEHLAREHAVKVP